MKEYKEKFDNETDWRKKVLIVEFFHLLQLTKHPSWRVRDTAFVLNKSIGLISEDLMLAKAIQSGEIEECTSRHKAIKLLRSK